jgi:CTP synthase
MRLGGYACVMQKGSLAERIYGATEVIERHRHRYEFNNNYKETLEAAGLVFSGTSKDENLVEMIEIPGHQWFVALQSHPEFTSTPRHGHPLFDGFINAARTNKSNKGA